MKKILKIIAVVLVLSVTAVIFVGCKSEKREKPKETTTGGTTVTTEPEPVYLSLRVETKDKSKTNPIKRRITFTFKNDTLDAVRYDDYYDTIEEVAKTGQKYGKNTEKYASVQYVEGTAPCVSYNLVDKSKWKDMSYEQLKKQYEKDEKYIVKSE